MSQNPPATLHYIHDPLCGWCYAATPMIDAAAQAGVAIVLHGGELWEPASHLAPEKRGYIRQSDARIAAMSGTPFGTAYLDGLLMAPDTVFWSRPTIAAVLAARIVESGVELRMMHGIQRAHYVEGRRVVEPAVLMEIAQEIDLAQTAFSDALGRARADKHIAETRAWMARFCLTGFPTFLLETRDGLARLDHESFYGRPGAFVDTISAAIAGTTSA